TSPSSIAIGDLNDDGKLDLIVANKGSNDVTILLGIGSPSHRFSAAGLPVTSCRRVGYEG
ncbi:MAG: FG-GAP repeat protein, partial [Bacteroidota bacterium]